MADKNKGNLRKRLVRPSRQVRDEKDEDAKLASELAGIVGKAVEKATDLGLSVVENVGLKVMESLSPRKPAARVGLMGAAASLFNSTRAKGPEVSRGSCRVWPSANGITTPSGARSSRPSTG